eukprot:SM010607S14117  [mRNA]  locus=s10607:220:438:+ [translate_table: standard]
MAPSATSTTPMHLTSVARSARAGEHPSAQVVGVHISQIAACPLTAGYCVVFHCHSLSTSNRLVNTSDTTWYA